jgi:hypothetical protein
MNIQINDNTDDAAEKRVLAPIISLGWTSTTRSFTAAFGVHRHNFCRSVFKMYRAFNK